MNKTINRSVLVIIPKKPYYDWGNRLTPDLPHTNSFDECNSYLLNDGWNISNAEEFLKLNFDGFFGDLLFDMWTEESAWPQDRTWKMFGEWFDWHFSSMVWDFSSEKKVMWKEW